jgi:hypothetical protein
VATAASRSGSPPALTLDVTQVVQPLAKVIPDRRVVDNADARELRLLLRARRERPRGGAAEKRG